MFSAVKYLSVLFTRLFQISIYYRKLNEFFNENLVNKGQNRDKKISVSLETNSTNASAIYNWHEPLKYKQRLPEQIFVCIFRS